VYCGVSKRLGNHVWLFIIFFLDDSLFGLFAFLIGTLCKGINKVSIKDWIYKEEIMGPLKGIRVIELEGIGPAPYCGMLLADLGAEVISITRKKSDTPRVHEISERNKKSVRLDLKSDHGREAILKLVATADILIEGYRPGVVEKLGIGPEQCLENNPALIYGRMTGWGQEGPLSKSAGHDINYIALTGALHAIGRKGQGPVPPLNLVGDFGGGALFLALGVVAALFEAKQSGIGQVVDAAMVDGTASLMHLMYSMMAAGNWVDKPESNVLDGAAPYYDTYQTADGKFVSIGSIEPQFYDLLIEKAGLDKNAFADRSYQRWPQLKSELADVIMTKTRDEWCAIMEGTDVCFAPVISMLEAPYHPHLAARNTYITLEGVLQPNIAPRFSRTQCNEPKPPRARGADTETVLQELGMLKNIG